MQGEELREKCIMVHKYNIDSLIYFIYATGEKEEKKKNYKGSYYVKTFAFITQTMSRSQFLGTIDRSINASLLINYDASIQIPDGTELNQIKRQDDLILIELGTLLTANECDEILTNIHGEAFENMLGRYDLTKRTNSRLIVIDDRLAEILWQRLKFSDKLTKLIPNPQPLGFNVQGQWEMSGVNQAIRINRYEEGEYFSVHKDGQYAPNADERSLFSLIIYLNDNYEKGETKFYFPKTTPQSDIKGLTIKEEIESYGGLENGFECVCIQPKKGHAILFTHNLLHEAIAPESLNPMTIIQRYVLRADVLVQRKEKLSGFAVSSIEKEDYLACLNFFREAQQNELREYQTPETSITTLKLKTGELYERSLSIRYCYPRLLINSHIKEEKSNSICHKLPTETWLNIFKYVNEQDIESFIFAYPYYLPLMMLRQSEETKFFETDRSRSKFIPTVENQYGCRTLFHFADVKFFDENIHGCCRVAAVYAFFLLGHTADSTTYIIRYNRNTHEVCEVQKERLFHDVFYNRNCYGALYRVKQKNESIRNLIVDFEDSVDRTYMINRHQSQFIGQDLPSRFHFLIKKWSAPDYGSQDKDYSQYLNERDLLAVQRETVLRFDTYKLVNECEDAKENTYAEGIRKRYDPIRGYRGNLNKQTQQEFGTSLCRMVSAKDHFISSGDCCMHTDCRGEYSAGIIHNLIQTYNHLVFDFNTHQLVVEQIARPLDSQNNSTVYYRVNVAKLAEKTKGFDHAGCRSYDPYFTIDQFSFLDYTYLSHVDLAITHEENYVSVESMYGGIVSL